MSLIWLSFESTRLLVLLTEFDVVTIEVEHLGSAKDGHVLELSLSDSGAVVGNDNKFGLSVSQHLHDCLEA